MKSLAAALLLAAGAHLGVFGQETAGEIPAITALSAGPFTLHVQARPFRMALHSGRRPLVAERARISSSIELLDEAGWHPLENVTRLDVEKTPADDEVRARVQVDCEGRGPAALDLRLRSDGSFSIACTPSGKGVVSLRDDFVTYADETLIVIPRRGSDKDASRRRILLSSRGYGLRAEAREEQARVLVSLPDPDAYRVEGPPGLELRFAAGAPADVLRRLAADGIAPRSPPAGEAALPRLWIEARDAEGSRAAGLTIGPARKAGLILPRGDELRWRLPGGSLVDRPPRALRIREWRDLREGLTALIEHALIGEGLPMALLPPEGDGSGAELRLRTIQAAAFGPLFVLPEGVIEEAVTSPSSPRRLLLAHEALDGIFEAESRRRVLRPLFIVHPEEDGAWKALDEWLLGRDILVAPVIEEGKEIREVYFPGGAWIDLREWGTPTPSIHRGPGSAEIRVPRAEVAVFAREGAAGDLPRELGRILSTRE